MTNNIQHYTYIWNHPDWPLFRWDADRLIEPLCRVSNLYGQLSGLMSMLGFEQRGKAQMDAISRELISSSAIEGVILNAESVRSSIARKLGLDSYILPYEDHYVEGLVSVAMDALSHDGRPLSDERLFGWHAALFPTGRSGQSRITVGAWRIGPEPMQVVSGPMGKEKVHYEAPPSDSVPEEMSRLIDWCNTSTLNPILKSAIVHLWFVTIHPFDDGNGRLSRILADMYLYLNEDDRSNRYFSISAEINREKKEYYDILESTQKGDLDITEWILWFISCLETAIQRTLSTVDQTLAKAKFWDKWAEVPINERQRKVLNRLWDGFDGKLTTSKWSKICHCSQDTALRDIHDLISKGMLYESKQSGRSTNYLLPDKD